MVSKQSLKSEGFASITAYFYSVADNHAGKKLELARGAYNRLSKPQKKEFLLYLQKDWQLTAEDSMYQFFFDKL